MDRFKSLGRETRIWIIIVASLLVLVIAGIAGLKIRDDQKIASMHEIANRIQPGSDWKVIYTPEEPQPNMWCIPTDSNCYRLGYTWESSTPVTVEEVASQLDMPMIRYLGPDVPYMKADDQGNTKNIEVSVSEPSSFNNGWVISLLMRYS